MSSLPSVVCIVGPTASGKSALAEMIAQRLETSIVSTDAMQVYKGMDIGTAKVPAEERIVPLLMVDMIDPVWEDYSVQLFQRDARAAIDALLACKKLPVLCGGTGLYLDAVIDEMYFPSGALKTPPRSKYEERAATEGPDVLYRLLQERDQKSAELIHPHNVRRVIRALEMYDEGVSYAKQHMGLRAHTPHYAASLWGLSMNRARLYERIDRRVEQMFAAGFVDEVKRLVEDGFTADSTAGQAIGYREVLSYLAGSCTLKEAVEAVKQHTRRYAKRQLSWLKRDGRVTWLDLDTIGMDEAADTVLSGIGEGQHESL